MMLVIHGERRHSIAVLYSKPFKRLRELSSIAGDIPPVRARGASARPGSHDFAVAMFALGVVDDARHAQRPVLHRPKPH
jgi:hypothetical protein